jgi:Uma2 family endonuclease
MVDMPKIKMTLEEYMELDETNQIIELIDGELLMTPPPLDEHQKDTVGIIIYLGKVLPSGALRVAPCGLHIGDHVFEPDIFWVSPENDRCVLVDGKYWEGAPDFVVEILSKSTEYRDRGIKFDTFQTHGVREYWLVEPTNKFIEVYVLVGNKFDRLGIFGRGTDFESPVLRRKVDVSVVLGL